jgi:hypothetical protein
MRRLRRPSPALVVAFVALVVALGGTALAATGQLVNIADGSKAANVAHVTNGGRLEVGDGDGPLTVDGQAAPAAPNTLVRVEGAGTGSNCVALGSPPSGKAWVLTSARINLYSASGLGPTQFIALFNDPGCAGLSLADDTPTQLGTEAIDLGDGLAIPAGATLAVRGFGNATLNYEVFAYGHSVPAGQVPAAGRAAKGSGRALPPAGR